VLGLFWGCSLCWEQVVPIIWQKEKKLKKNSIFGIKKVSILEKEIYFWKKCFLFLDLKNNNMMW